MRPIHAMQLAQPIVAAGGISFVGSGLHKANNGGDSVFAVGVDLLDEAGNPATLLQDDFLLFRQSIATTATNITFATPTGFTKQSDLIESGVTNRTNLAMFTKFVGAVPDTTITFVGDGDVDHGNQVVGFAFRGVHLTNPLDVASVVISGTGSAAPNPSAVTPVTAGAWPFALCAGAAGTGAVFANGGDMSAVNNHFRADFVVELVDALIGMGIKTNWASGPVDFAAWTGASGAGASWIALTNALRPA